MIYLWSKIRKLSFLKIESFFLSLESFPSSEPTLSSRELGCLNFDYNLKRTRGPWPFQLIIRDHTREPIILHPICPVNFGHAHFNGRISMRRTLLHSLDTHSHALGFFLSRILSQNFEWMRCKGQMRSFMDMYWPVSSHVWSTFESIICTNMVFMSYVCNFYVTTTCKCSGYIYRRQAVFEAQWIEASVFRPWKGQSSISHNLCDINQLWISWDED